MPRVLKWNQKQLLWWTFDITKRLWVVSQVMSASDQLRQRMAWALSQILVVGTGGFGHTRQTELWLNYYDILVRKAGSWISGGLLQLRSTKMSPPQKEK